MITNLKDFNEKVIAFADAVVKKACENTTSGQYYVNAENIAKEIGMDFGDFLHFKDVIEGEVFSREEVLEGKFYNTTLEFDVNCALDYCPHYEWCEGDEEVFGCSYEEWLERSVLPVGQKAPAPVFYVGDGVYTDKEFSDFESARDAFDMLTKHNLEDITLGVKLPSKEGQVLLYSNKGIEEVAIGASDLKRLHLDKKVVEDLEAQREEAQREALCTMNDLIVGKWRVHVVEPGGRYGLNNCLVNEEQKSLLEFWDMSANKSSFPDGQFVSRYYIDTLFEDTWGPGPQDLMRGGLCLDGLNANVWSVSGREMTKVFDWLKNRELIPGEHYSEYHMDIDIHVFYEYVAKNILFSKLNSIALVRDVKDLECLGSCNDGMGLKMSVVFNTQANKDAVQKAFAQAFDTYNYELSCEKKVVEVQKEPLDKVIKECAAQVKDEPGVKVKDRGLDKDNR